MSPGNSVQLFTDRLEVPDKGLVVFAAALRIGRA